MAIDFKSTNEAALTNALSLLYRWLPGGKLIGSEYTCGSLDGGQGDSCKVNIVSGKWCDFATGDKGGDLISLYAAINKMTQMDAANVINGLVGMVDRSELIPIQGDSELFKLVPPPHWAQIPDMSKSKNSGALFNRYWEYKDLEGKLLFYVARYHYADGRKDYNSFSWNAKTSSWVRKMWPTARPLYGLEYLGNPKTPDKSVLIVEGEKACDAARELLGSYYICVTWMGGVNAIAKTDWTSLYGRQVTIWPDADNSLKYPNNHGLAGQPMPYEEQPGPKCGMAIARMLLPRCPQVKILNVSGMPHAWDAADALADGWDTKRVTTWAKERVSILTVPYKEEIQRYEVTQVSMEELVDIREDAIDMIGYNTPSETRELWEKLGLVQEGGRATALHGTVRNAAQILLAYKPYKDLLWFDDFHKKIFTNKGGKTPREWKEHDTIGLTIAFQGELDFHKIKKTTVHDAVEYVAKRTIKNEPKDWMETLNWDGVSRVADFFPQYYGAIDNDYTRSISNNFWVSLVARIYEPGCKVDNMVILEGGQGKFKSTSLNIIGGKWYAEINESVNSKDFFMVFRGKLIIEIGELDSFSKAESNTIKKIISTAVDVYRTPYARDVNDHYRCSIFVGTTNEHEYLKDPTGARRFWPLSIGNIDLERLKRDREQLFAEAVHLYKAGVKWYEMPKELTEEIQESRTRVDEWEQIISEFLDLHQGKGFYVADIAKDSRLSINPDRLDRIVQNRITSILRRLEYSHRAKRFDGKTRRFWVHKNVPDDYEIYVSIPTRSMIDRYSGNNY